MPPIIRVNGQSEPLFTLTPTDQFKVGIKTDRLDKSDFVVRVSKDAADAVITTAEYGDDETASYEKTFGLPVIVGVDLDVSFEPQEAVWYFTLPEEHENPDDITVVHVDEADPPTLTPVTTEHLGDGSYKATLTSKFSPWLVIDAKNIIKSPKLCNNDGKCNNNENSATCPLDCLTTSPDGVCEDGETKCIGNKLYVCKKKFIEKEKCEFGCDPETNKCRDKPLPNFPLIFMFVAIGAMVMMLALAVIFLRR